MRVLVPKSINVKALVEELDLSETRKENLKNKIYYFLSKVVDTNLNYNLNENNDSYHDICSVIMRKVMGRKDYYLMLDLLSDPDDPIIESDNSWKNTTGNISLGYCKGYRMTATYNTGEVEYKTLPTKYSKRILKHIPEEKSSREMTERYSFLIDQFHKHKLAFDPLVYDYIRTFGQRIFENIQGNNPYQAKAVLNLIGRWFYQVEKIENGDIWHSVSGKNHRLHSSITSLNHLLRPFLLCDGRPMAMLDISASQPYFLASAMDPSFLSSSNEGYNLFSIYPELYNELVARGFITSSVINSTYSGNTGNTFTGINNLSSIKNGPIYDSLNLSNNPANYRYFSITGSTLNPEFIINTSSNKEEASTSLCPFMWGQFFNEREFESIANYMSLPFERDFYKHLYEICNNRDLSEEDFNEEQREKIKDEMMYILFQNNWGHRNNDKNMRSFNITYPGVDKWICSALKAIGKTKFSYLLQRAESFLLLNTVSREFNNKFSSAPIFSIHDAILTYEEYLPDLTSLILGRFYETTGIRVGIKTKLEKPIPEPKPKDILSEWAEIEPINSLGKYQKTRGIFKDNIERGAKFLNLTL